MPIPRRLSWLGAALVALVPGCTPTSPGPPMRYYFTCGDPVCRGYTPPTGVPRCTFEFQGEACSKPDAACDPRDSCNRLLKCTTEPPAQCPVSLRAFKRDVAYLGEAERRRYLQAVLDVRLATYRYEGEPAGAAGRLGFLIDDRPPQEALRPDGTSVDLYGYTSLAVAALQAQQREIEELRRELRELRRQVASRP